MKVYGLTPANVAAGIAVVQPWGVDVNSGVKDADGFKDATVLEALAEAPPVPAVVMVGPEGGFLPFEVQLAESVGAQRVGLGERILSVDTALVTVLAEGLLGSC